MRVGLYDVYENYGYWVVVVSDPQDAIELAMMEEFETKEQAIHYARAHSPD